MNKKKIVMFLLILLICPAILIIKDKVISKDDVYVLTEENNIPEEKKNEKEKTSNEENINNKEITVYISGAISKPGIVTLKEGDRLAKAVEKLGGTTKKADLNRVNLAIKVADEKHYIIPQVGEEINAISNETASNINESTSSKLSQININTATIEELDTLPGVGEATANKIINHRNENGEFKSIEEIKNVNGIGDKKFENIKHLISIK